ncbi:MAG: S-adenosylmethionine:tRNA ribosyltransferase-isomerase [Clostridia bacterium]|nr:S-adenosylmethionine:tRNA ribosyltransferase-isomerase [Clostridia bacterium]
MKTSDFFYELPEELIAQTPLPQRDASRLLVLDKRTGETRHRRFPDIVEELDAGDLLVLNDSRVIPARHFSICAMFACRSFVTVPSYRLYSRRGIRSRRTVPCFSAIRPIH